MLTALRRIPVCPQHRWAAYVAYVHDCITYVAGHLAMPFGASSSVWAWDRVSAAIVRIARVALRICVTWMIDLQLSARSALHIAKLAWSDLSVPYWVMAALRRNISSACLSKYWVLVLTPTCRGYRCGQARTRLRNGLQRLMATCSANLFRLVPPRSWQESSRGARNTFFTGLAVLIYEFCTT